MGQQIMSWRNVEIPLDVGYKHQVHTRRIVAVEQQKLPPQSESLIWARMEGDCEENRLWVFEPAEIQTELLSAKALVQSTEQKIVPVRVLNLSGHGKVISKSSDVGQCEPVEAVINEEQPPEPAEMSAKDFVKMWRNR